MIFSDRAGNCGIRQGVQQEQPNYEAEPNEDRWKDTGTPGFFFAELDEVRQAVIELRDEVTSNEDDEPSWSPVRIERIELLAPTAQNLLTLLNEGIGPLVQSYEIVETIA